MINLIRETRAITRAVFEVKAEIVALRSEVAALQTKECDQPHFPCLRQHYEPLAPLHWQQWTRPYLTDGTVETSAAATPGFGGHGWD